MFTATLTMYKQFKLKMVREVRRCEVDVMRLNEDATYSKHAETLHSN